MDSKNMHFLAYKKHYRDAVKAMVDGELKKAEISFTKSYTYIMRCIDIDDGENRNQYFKLADEVNDHLSKIKDRLRKNPSTVSDAKTSEDNPGEENLWVSEENLIRFEDVIGLDDVKDNVRRMVIFPLKYQELYKAFKRKSGGGILLYGVPGTGKTMIAQAIANEINAKLFYVKCSDIISHWFGESEKNVRKLFEEARKNDKSVIFFDEFEALGMDRDERHSPSKRIVSELLANIQEFEKGSSTLLVIAATNRPWEIDSALLRSGRIATHICVGLPSYDSRLGIIEKNLNDVPINTNFSYDDVAKATEGFSGADIVDVCNKLKDNAIIRSIFLNAVSAISNDDFAAIKQELRSSVSKSDLDKIHRYSQNGSIDFTSII